MKRQMSRYIENLWIKYSVTTLEPGARLVLIHGLT